MKQHVLIYDINTYFVVELSKTASENIHFQPAKRKYISQKFVDVPHGPKYVFDSILASWLLLREKNTNLPILLNVQIYSLLAVLINYRSFAPAFHALLTKSFSLYPFLRLSYSTEHLFYLSGGDWKKRVQLD